MPRQPSIQELLQSAERASSLRMGGQPAQAGRHRSLARLRARMPRHVPSARDRQIFEDVVIRRQTQQEAALHAGISRQCVARIVQRTRDWIAFCGGDDAAYGPEQRSRLATHVATCELSEFQRLVGEALSMADRILEGKKIRRDEQGNETCSELSYQTYPRPTSLYKMLLDAILARAKLGGAALEQSAAGGSRSMVMRTPPKEALHSDKLSGPTCARESAGTVNRTTGVHES